MRANNPFFFADVYMIVGQIRLSFCADKIPVIWMETSFSGKNLYIHIYKHIRTFSPFFCVFFELGTGNHRKYHQKQSRRWSCYQWSMGYVTRHMYWYMARKWQSQMVKWCEMQVLWKNNPWKQKRTPGFPLASYMFMGLMAYECSGLLPKHPKPQKTTNSWDDDGVPY